jgi:hypothetical protein
MARRTSILILLALMVTLSPASTAKTRKKPRPAGGTYTLEVAGYLRGDGSAVVTPGQGVQLSLFVAREAGGGASPVNVTLKYLQGAGNSHVAGDQTIFGKPAHFEGRVDVPDDEKELAIRGVRLVCRIRSADGKYASVIGWVKALAEAEDDIDRQDRGRGRGNNKP